MKRVLTLLLLLSLSANAQYGMDKIEAEIKNMQSAGVKAYWTALHNADQTAVSNNTLDNKTAALNLYKVVLMVHHHGYPTSSDYGYPAYTTPWLVWTHCRAVGLKQYTFGMIMYGKMLGQLPDDRYPNYFVGGWLSDLYGLDMEFDPDFHKNGNIIQKTLNRFDGQAADPEVLRDLVKGYIAMVAMPTGKTLGTWVIKQHDTSNHFTIVQLTDGNWYLQTRNENGPTTIRPLMGDANLKYFEFTEGFGDFHLVIKDNKLELRDKKDELVKVSG